MWAIGQNAVGTASTAPRTVSRQRNRCNVPFFTTHKYYRRAIFLPLLEHIIEMSSRFGLLQVKAIMLFSLLPPVIAELDQAVTTEPDESDCVDTGPTSHSSIEFRAEWLDDLPSLKYLTLNMIAGKRSWRGKKRLTGQSLYWKHWMSEDEDWDSKCENPVTADLHSSSHLSWNRKVQHCPCKFENKSV